MFHCHKVGIWSGGHLGEDVEGVDKVEGWSHIMYSYEFWYLVNCPCSVNFQKTLSLDSPIAISAQNSYEYLTVVNNMGNPAGTFACTHTCTCVVGMGLLAGQAFRTWGIPVPVPMVGNLWVCPN